MRFSNPMPSLGGLRAFERRRGAGASWRRPTSWGSPRCGQPAVKALEARLGLPCSSAGPGAGADGGRPRLRPGAEGGIRRDRGGDPPAGAARRPRPARLRRTPASRPAGCCRGSPGSRRSSAHRAGDPERQPPGRGGHGRRRRGDRQGRAGWGDLACVYLFTEPWCRSPARRCAAVRSAVRTARRCTLLTAETRPADGMPGPWRWTAAATAPAAESGRRRL